MCGDKKYEDTPVIPHDFGSWIERIRPTCTQKGEKVRQCTTCGFTEKQKINELGHKFSQWTKNAQGIETRHCLNCGQTETDKSHFLRDEEKTLQKAMRFEKSGKNEEAFTLYERLAKNGNAFALYKTAGIAKSEQEYVSNLREAADLGCAEAQAALGIFYFKKQLPQLAKLWLEKAADQGNVDANTYLGVMYYTGKVFLKISI